MKSFAELNYLKRRGKADICKEENWMIEILNIVFLLCYCIGIEE